MNRQAATVLAVLLVAMITVLAMGGARAADLPSVDAGIQWGPLAIAALVGAAIVGAVVLIRHNPGAVAKAKDATAAASSEAETLKSGLSTVVGQLSEVVRDLSAHVKALTNPPTVVLAQTANEEPKPEAPPAPAGKVGQAGTFSVAVTGDPAIDLPAITAAYYERPAGIPSGAPEASTT